MKEVLRIIVLTALTSFFSTSCEKVVIKPDPEGTPTRCFESLYKRVKERYAFLKYKNINWDSVRDALAPKVYDDMSDDSLFKVLDEMLYNLRDGHVNLISPFNISRNWQWYLGYPQNFNSTVLERNYLGNDYHITGPFINKIFVRNNKKIGYMRYSSFSSDFSDYQLNYVITRFQNTDGLIIDLRNNGGGRVNNIYKLINRFVTEKTLIGREYEKSGPGLNDFKLSIEQYAEPAKDEKGNPLLQYLYKPIVLLTNRSCYSACNSFVAGMSILNNVTIVGDQTGGGGGLPTSYQLPNGWVYRISTTYSELPDGFNIEHGIPADIHINMDPLREAAGIDDILEKAFELF
ncbi:MAG: S41 family peptidase [Cytophagaceae bacterium]|nr:S41 family peptidase [Cytophagaceae bacterium]MDW8456953.1 S41 family peptidase [Cytophagaceae bacterium]